MHLYHNGVPILLQTGPLRTVSGVQKDDKFGKHTMCLVLDPESIEFKKLEVFDARVLEMATKSTWLKQNARVKTSRSSESCTPRP